MQGLPAHQRVHVFVDGQNLYHAAKEAFNYTYPNYDIHALSNAVCRTQGWTPTRISFYTGVPSARDDARWNTFWGKKFIGMGRRGINIFHRELRYREQTVRIGTTRVTGIVGQEKGIDVRIAVDIIRGALENRYDMALVFSQDQDLSEVADEIRLIARQNKRPIAMASALPVGPGTKNDRGVNHTQWIKIDRATYDACLDPNDYR